MDQKERIAKTALAELPDEGSILLDAGTTTYRLAAALPPDRELTVVTSSAAIATLLSSTRPRLTLMMIGGLLSPGADSAVGHWPKVTLRGIYVDVAFLGTSGVSPAAGLTAHEPEIADVKRAVVASARRVVVLADHTKLGHAHPFRFADLADVDTLVTDSNADPRAVEEIASCGPRVVIA